MRLSKPTKRPPRKCLNSTEYKQWVKNDQHKVLRMIARNEQLERYDGKWVALNRKYKDRSKYDREDAKRELRRDLRGSYCVYMDCKMYFSHVLEG